MEKKREYLRLPVRVHFNYNVVDERDKNRIVEDITKGNTICPNFEEIESFAKLIMEQHKMSETKEINSVVLEILLLILNRLGKIEEHLIGKPTHLYQNEGMTEDLSGGGFSFISDKIYETGTLLDVLLDIKMFPKCGIRVLGKIVRRENYEDNYKYGVGFEFIREEDREDLIKFLFIKQREILAKRRLEKEE